jgi:DDE superfamily endonuclease
MVRPDLHLPQAFIAWMAPFLAAFRRRSRDTAAALAVGALLAIGPRTVTNCLRALGLAEHPSFTAFHRVLNRNVWSGLALARTLLGQLVPAFEPSRPFVIIGVDHTLERRRGRRIEPASHFHDAVRSTAKQKITSRGLRWISAMLLVQVPFAGRIWGLPVLTALTPSKAWCEHHKRRYRPVTKWAEMAKVPMAQAIGMPSEGELLLLTLHRWLPDRMIVAVMDGEFTAIDLLHRLRRYMIVVTRLRLDACLFDPPSPYKGHGRHPQKGAQQPSLMARITDPATVWKRTVQASRTSWRTGGWIEYAFGTALWYHGGKEPLPIRWVLVRYPDKRHDTEAFLCTDTQMGPVDVLDCYNRRWSMETTYEEARAHLGVETQRQWSDPAIFRTTPLLFGLYSLVTLYVQQNAERLALSPRRAAWYPKPAATFADALARLRQHVWFERFATSAGAADIKESLPPDLQQLIQLACYAP